LRRDYGAFRRWPANGARRIHLRFIATFKRALKQSPDDRARSHGDFCASDKGRARFHGSDRGAQNGEAAMADIVMAALSAAEPADAGACFARGMVYSSGAGVPVDLIEAHKWFNIAAMRGHADAAQLRREIAEQMSDAEIGSAQRAARAWLKANPQAQAQPAPIRAAA
jgi:hypothetical protein